MNTKKWTLEEITTKIKSVFAQEFGKECGVEEKDVILTAILKYDYSINTEDYYFKVFFLKVIEVIFNIDLEFTKRELADLTLQKLSDAVNVRVNVLSTAEKVN